MLSCKVRLAPWHLGSRIIDNFAVVRYFPRAPGRGRPLVGLPSPLMREGKALGISGHMVTPAIGFEDHILLMCLGFQNRRSKRCHVFNSLFVCTSVHLQLGYRGSQRATWRGFSAIPCGQPLMRLKMCGSVSSISVQSLISRFSFLFPLPGGQAEGENSNNHVQRDSMVEAVTVRGTRTIC